ncbi:MAG: glycosyltransferase [Bacteroidia bacterium]|nr:glycosyltransferase [Bacteroidia bacterium]
MQISSRKHIVIAGPAHPLRGGIAAFNERLARALQDEGHRVSIYTFKFQYPAFLFPGKTQYSTDPAPSELDIRVKIHSMNPFNWYQVGRELKHLRPDHLILRFWIPFISPSLGKIGRIVKSNHHTRITGLLDNVIPHEKRPGDDLLIRYFINSCDDFLSMSHQVTKDLRSFSEKPCRYSPHPVYDQYGEQVGKKEACEKLGLDPDGEYLLFFGLVRKYKGLDLLLEAFAATHLAKSKFKLLVAGEFYEDPSMYNAIIEKYQLQNRVILHSHFIPDHEVKYYFSASSLVAQTYRSATQSGISQLAFQFEKPMLVTNVGGLGEIIVDGKTGFVTDIETEKIRAALDLYSKEGLPAGFTEAIAAEKKKYSWTSFVSTLINN